jgi:EAL domain-containing protein (putative c-di-GMP-specific phosphodiesterase class I)
LSLKLAHSGTEQPAAPETVTAETLGRQLRAMLPPIRLHSMSIYNLHGDVLWLSEGALGPDEHSVVLDSIQAMHDESRKSYHETGLDDGRFAMFLAIRAPRGDLVGAVMLLSESRTIPEGTKEQLASARVRGMIQKIAVFMRVGSGDTTSSSVLPPPAVPAAGATVTNERVDEILTLEADPDATQLAPHVADRLSQASAADEATVIAPPHLAAQITATVRAKVDSAEEVAADLTLSVQELCKMRSNGRTRRYEVLARSRRDAQRDAVPAAFMSSIASRDGSALDGAVAHQLIEWMREHPEVWNGDPASFSVNVSIGAIEDPRFLETIAAEMKAADIPANSIGFEITEFACKQCRTPVQRFVTACERIGCFVVLDNFTFDSAAVPLLGSSAVRMVKIDPKLTTLAMKEKLPQAVVIAILQACKVLGVHCIAKNVETQATLDWLEAIGCDFAQGFALEKPLSLESLASPSPTLPRGRGKEGKTRR